MGKYVSKYKKRFLRWKKTTRNHVERMKAIGTWHKLPRLTWMEWKGRLDEFQNHCGYCLKKFNPDVLWLEHIVGIHEHGLHRIENVIPSCQLCNQKKGNKTLWDFQQITTEELFSRIKEHLEQCECKDK